MQMQYTHIINNESILGIIRRFCSYIDTRLTEHGTHVAYIIYRMIGKTGQYTDEELRNICFAAQLHDIGAFKTEDVSSMLHFETKDVWNHSFYGYLFIQYFSPLTEFAPGPAPSYRLAFLKKSGKLKQGTERFSPAHPHR